MMKFSIKILFLIFIFILNLEAQNVSEQRYKLAESYEETGDFDSALRIYTELTKENPKSDKYFAAYSRVMKNLNKYSELLNAVKDRIENFENFDLLDLFAELSWRVGNTVEANKSWDKILDTYSKDQNTYLKVSQTQINLRLFDKAISTLILGRKRLGSSEIFDDPLVKLYIAIGDYKNGFSEIISQFHKKYNIAQAQGRLYALMINEEANIFIGQELKKLSNDFVENIFFQEIYSWYLRTTGNAVESLNLVKSIDKLKGSKGLDILNFANVTSYDGNYDIAIQAYKLVIDMGKNSPYVSSALFGFTKTLEDKINIDKKEISKKDADEIVESYLEIIKNYPHTANSADSRLRLAQIYEEIYKDNKKAISELEKVIKEFPQSQYAVSANLELGKIYIKNDDLDLARTSFAKLDEIFRFASPEQKDQFMYFKAMILYYKGEIEEAQKSFSALALNPDTDIANDVLKKLFIIKENEQYVAALQIFAKAELREYQKRTVESLQLYKETIELSGKTQLSELSLYKSAFLEFNNKNYQNCRNFISKLSQAYPDSKENDKYVYLTAESYYFEENHPEALKYYTELITKYPSSIYIQDSRKKIRIIREDKI